MPKGNEKLRPSLWWLVDRDGNMRRQCIARDSGDARAEFIRQRGTSLPAAWKIIPAPRWAQSEDGEPPKPAKKPEPELEDHTIVLPKIIAARVDFLGSLCGLTGDQMLSAIVVLHMNREGWIGAPKVE